MNTARDSQKDQHGAPVPKADLGKALIGVIAAVIADAFAPSSAQSAMGGQKMNTAGQKDQHKDAPTDNKANAVKAEECAPVPKLTVGEAAALVGVTAAVIAGASLILGTVVRSFFLETLGFDSGQFPSATSQLQVLGFWYVVAPSFFIGFAILIGIGAMAAPDRVFGWKQKESKGGKRVPQALLPIFLSIVLFAVPLITIKHVMGEAREFAESWKKKATACTITDPIQPPACPIKPPACPIIELTDPTDPSKTVSFPAPGAMVVCSERFCGFHDGKTATVIPLRGVRSIRSPCPETVTLDWFHIELSPLPPSQVVLTTPRGGTAGSAPPISVAANLPPIRLSPPSADRIRFSANTLSIPE